MQDLLDLISDQPRWKKIQPLVQQTFSRTVELFQKFNNKLAYIENTIYNKNKQINQTQIDHKTIFKEHTVKWKSPLKQTLPNKTRRLPKQIEKNKNKNKKVKQIFPQQLYLQSNQTMFTMLVQQIQKLKSMAKQPKHSRTNYTQIKLQIRQCQLEQQIQSLIQFVNNNLPTQKQQNKLDMVVPQISLSVPIQTDITMKLFEIQRQLLSKPSLQAVSQMIQNQYSQINDNIQELQEYTQTNLTSINKILNHQSSINLQVCREMKVGKWLWQVPWQKQIVNLFPQNVIWSQNSTTLVIKESGFYKIDIYVMGQNTTIGIILNNDTSLFKKEQSMTFGNKYTDILQVIHNSSFSVSTQNGRGTLIMILQKII